MDASERRKLAASAAADWWVRLQAADLPGVQRGEFVDWLRESPVHVAEMLRIAQVHGALERFERWTGISATPLVTQRAAEIIPLRPTDRVETGMSARKGWRRAAQALSIAASVVAVLIGGSYLQERIFGKLIATEQAERREVVLKDGSVVQVDPETRLRIRFSENVRNVYLERGRALFHVAKNAQRPFLVHSDDTVVRAVGTAFGVEHTRRATIVTVAEGKVAVLSERTKEPTPALVHSTSSQALSSTAQVSGQHGAGQKTAQHGASNDVERGVFLTANQQVTVGQSGSAEPVRLVDSHRELAWAEGRLIFRNDPVTRVIEEFNRYNRVQLHVTDGKLASRSVSGVFNASEPEAFIAFLQSVAPVEIIHTDETAITIAPAVETDK